MSLALQKSLLENLFSAVLRFFAYNFEMENKSLFDFDVLIAGGGPSGAALGNLLASSGISCCVADKAFFPREKLCGGLVTAKTRKLACEIAGKDILSASDAYEMRDIAFFYEGAPVAATSVDSPFNIVERRIFDNALLRLFVEKGGTLLEGREVVSVDTGVNCVKLKTGETLHYRVLVGADGVYSKIRPLVEQHPLPTAFCCEAFVPKDTVNLGDCIAMHFGLVPYGYAWVFPRSDSYAVGFGGLAPKDFDYKTTMAYLLEAIGAPSIPFKGMHVPYGHFVRKPVKRNILLVGDAAGLVDSMTGEGLYYALLSAKKASAAILNFLHSGEKLDAYVASLAPIHAHIKSATRAQRFFYNRQIQKAIFKRAHGRTNFVRYAAENVISNGDMTWGEAFLKYFGEKIFGR